ncbi:adenylate/guanylate cyclase domain-containing protein [Nordella sp. HKS 07]|uniref:CHASE2 domain-containing protein n=1 Tax=Nordella sp. HKS 07 TaxID=2712222 RepID=UPI0013E1342C|nr:adenylate/guanylate cyclase domain-containing protein [Nordella sp. HKS 07]QIG47458.1 adenylate/guanylate cyclase domain-containing protein [Nordella sp. HKS 07]
MLFLAAAVLLVAGFSRPLENLYRDLLISSVSPFIDPGQDIVIVAITEETLAGLHYRSPIDREFLANLIVHVGKAGPRAVGIDILFDQGTERAKDELLERALENAPFPVVIASAENADGLTDSQVTYLKNFAPGVSRGLVSLARDPLDGVVRGLFAGRENGGVWQPSFVGAIAAAGGASPSAIRSDLAYFRTQHATPYDFPVYPAHLARVLPVQWFTGKYVLIGADLPLDDRHLTPFTALDGVKAGTLPGVVIHAHALAQLLTGDQIVQAGALTVGLLLAAGALVAGWFAWRPLPVLVKPLILLGLIFSIFAGAATLFSRIGVLVPAVWPSVLVTGVFSIVAFMAWHRDNAERRFIRHAFAQYVSPAVVETIIRNPASLRLGGERRTITCVFTDLEGFTGLSETLPPERIAALLNGYLDLVCDQFVKHGATIDKVVGDSVVGFFGAPATQADQAERAVSLALELDTLAQAYRVAAARGGAHLESRASVFIADRLWWATLEESASSTTRPLATQ